MNVTWLRTFEVMMTTGKQAVRYLAMLEPLRNAFCVVTVIAVQHTNLI